MHNKTNRPTIKHAAQMEVTEGLRKPRLPDEPRRLGQTSYTGRGFKQTNLVPLHRTIVRLWSWVQTDEPQKKSSSQTPSGRLPGCGGKFPSPSAPSEARQIQIGPAESYRFRFAAQQSDAKDDKYRTYDTYDIEHGMLASLPHLPAVVRRSLGQGPQFPANAPNERLPRGRLPLGRTPCPETSRKHAAGCKQQKVYWWIRRYLGDKSLEELARLQVGGEGFL